MREITRDDHGHATFKCDCGATVTAYSWWCVPCPKCSREYNGSGQLLRSDWRRNASLYDDEIGDLEGYEMAHAGDS